MVDRFRYNCEILNKLGTIVLNNPNLRFCQILSILDLDKDRFYEEPDKTLKSINENRILKDKK